MTIEVGNRNGGGSIRVSKPLLKQRLQLAHVVEAQIESFKSGDGGLGEVIAIEFAKSKANISLGVSKLDTLLLEHLGEGFQLLQVC